jgi:hypothetical protein
MKKKTSESRTTTRREILKKGSYVVPAVLTLAVKPSFAAAASGSGGGGATGSRPRPATGARPRK